MCQLTMIDVKDEKVFPVNMVKYLTMLTTLENNYDGFGYSSFNSIDIVKSAKPAINWWGENYQNFTENFINGIYHVRRSSYKNVKPVDEHAHPFQENSIILAHNGSLNVVHDHMDIDLFSEFIHRFDLIDSQKFLKVLATYVGEGIVSAEAIDKAIDVFRGTFAFLIRDLNAQDVWVVRGKTKFLHRVNIYSRDEGEVSGMIVNTHYDQLRMLREIFNDTQLSYSMGEISLLPEETVFHYTPGTYKLDNVGKALEDRKNRNLKPVAKHLTAGKVGTGVGAATNPFDSVVRLIIKCGVSLRELLVISEVLFNRNFLLLDKTELGYLEDFLKQLSNESFSGRHEAWDEGKKRIETFINAKAYAQTKLSFPYILNSKSAIDKAFEDVSPNV